MKYIIHALKVILIVTIIIAGYYFAYLKPHQAKMKENAIHYSFLVQNRIAFINLAKLNPELADFDAQKANLIDIIRLTNSKGLEKPINNEEKRILEKETSILNKVFQTKSYADGVAILKSEESIKILEDETKLIDSLRPAR